MVKHMLRTNALLTLHIKSFIVQSPCLFFSCMRTVLQKEKEKRKRRHCVDDRFAQCSLLGLSTTVLYFHSNWGMFTVAKCGVIFHDTQYERKPCVCALCSITVTSSGVITVSELKATAGWGFTLLYYTRLPCVHHLYSLMEIQVNHLIQTSCGSGRPTSFPGLLLEFYFFWRSHFTSESCSLLPVTWTPSPLPMLVSCEG